MPLLIILFLFIYLSISPTTNADSISSADLAKQLATITDAIPKQRTPPKYPNIEAKNGNDGFVVMSFVVEPDGSTSNILVEQSSGSKHFEKAAKKALRKWTYQPATENGEAIQQCKNTVQLDFIMNNSKGNAVSRKFYRLYNNFNKALSADNSDLKALEDTFNEINDFKLQTSAEFYYQHLINSQYHGKMGDKVKQLYHLSSAVSFSDSYSYFKTIAKDPSKTSSTKEDKLFPLYHQKLQLELDLEKISAAQQSANKLLLLSNNTVHHPTYENIKNQLEQLIASDKPLLVNGNIGEREFWRHTLLRNNFEFTNIQGQLTKIDVRCRNKRHVFTVNETSSWNIPQSWQSCSVYVYGEDNASFTLVESNEAALVEQDKLSTAATATDTTNTAKAVNRANRAKTTMTNESR